jgi:hypothetical protein
MNSDTFRETRVLYLGLDGVVHHRDVRWCPQCGPCMQPLGHRLFQHIGLLEELLAPHPEIRIVLSTSWVPRYGIWRTMEYFPSSLRQRMVGATFHERMDQASFVALPRGVQIWRDVQLRWLPHWLALDDDVHGWPRRCRGYLIRANETLGISDSYVLPEFRQKLVNGWH